METDSLTKKERQQRTILLITDLAEFRVKRQELLSIIQRGGSYRVFMKSRGLDGQTWEIITKTLQAAGLISA